MLSQHAPCCIAATVAEFASKCGVLLHRCFALITSSSTGHHLSLTFPLPSLHYLISQISSPSSLFALSPSFMWSSNPSLCRCFMHHCDLSHWLLHRLWPTCELMEAIEKETMTKAFWLNT